MAAVMIIKTYQRDGTSTGGSLADVVQRYLPELIKRLDYIDPAIAPPRDDIELVHEIVDADVPMPLPDHEKANYVVCIEAPSLPLTDHREGITKYAARLLQDLLPLGAVLNVVVNP